MEAYMEGSAADLLRDNPFDSIEDLLDFPNEEDVLAMVDAHAEGASLAPVPVNSAGGCATGIAGGIHVRPSSIAGVEINSEEDALGLCNDMDITNLEWLSTFFEDSEFNFDFPTTAFSATGPNNGKDGLLFRSLSPTSVLEHNTLRGGGGGASYSSTSSCSSSNSGGGGGGMTARPSVSTTHTNTRARTKRPRPQSFYTRSFVPPPSSDSVMITAPTRPTEPETVGESFPGPFKRRKKKKTIAALGTEVNLETGAVTLASPMVRKCLHCDIQKTPQWRAGPMGPKTLCNACGVRYKSGRLFPEYRPAASPTFVPSIHSNSHKKVVEMRLRATQVAADKDGMRLLEGAVAVKNCDLLEYIRRRD